MIIAAYIFLGVFCVLCAAALLGSLLLGIAWWHDRYRSRGWHRVAARQQISPIRFQLRRPHFRS